MEHPKFKVQGSSFLFNSPLFFVSYYPFLFKILYFIFHETSQIKSPGELISI